MGFVATQGHPGTILSGNGNNFEEAWTNFHLHIQGLTPVEIIPKLSTSGIGRQYGLQEFSQLGGIWERNAKTKLPLDSTSVAHE